MTTAEIANLLGFVGAAGGIAVFVPQVLAVWRTKETRGISLGSFALLVLVSVVWTIYGVLMNSAPLILVNVFVGLSGLSIVLMKLRYG